MKPDQGRSVLCSFYYRPKVSWFKSVFPSDLTSISRELDEQIVFQNLIFFYCVQTRSKRFVQQSIMLHIIKV